MDCQSPDGAHQRKNNPACLAGKRSSAPKAAQKSAKGHAKKRQKPRRATGTQKPEGGIAGRSRGAFRVSYPQIFPDLIARCAVATGAAAGLPIWQAESGYGMQDAKTRPSPRSIAIPHRDGCFPAFPNFPPPPAFRPPRAAGACPLCRPEVKLGLLRRFKAEKLHPSRLFIHRFFLF